MSASDMESSAPQIEAVNIGENSSAVPAVCPNPLTKAEREQRQLARVSHGLFVKAESGRRLRDRRVRRLVARVRASMTWLMDSDVPAVRAWSELEIIGASVFADLVMNGLTNSQGDPRRLLGEYRMLRQTQLAYERELGMTPAARASLGVKAIQIQDLATVMAETDR